MLRGLLLQSEPQDVKIKVLCFCVKWEAVLLLQSVSLWDYGKCRPIVKAVQPVFILWQRGGLRSVCVFLSFPSSRLTLYVSASFFMLTYHHCVCVSVVSVSSGCLCPDCFAFSVPLCLFSPTSCFTHTDTQTHTWLLVHLKLKAPTLLSLLKTSLTYSNHRLHQNTACCYF